MAVEVIEFDKNNPQDNFKYMAKNMDGEYEVGYIVVKQPWYSNPKDWTYYIVKNKYGMPYRDKNNQYLIDENGTETVKWFNINYNDFNQTINEVLNYLKK